MAPIASNSSTWSSLDYESHSGSSGISSSLMVLPIIQHPQQQQQQQQRFRIHHPAMMKSYGSVSSFEDPYVSLLGPAKPPRASSGPFRNYSKFTLALSHNQQQQQQQQSQHRRISKSDWDLSHVGTCNMEPVYCDNKCGQKVSRKNMAHHKAIECSKRVVTCRHCAKEFGCDTLASHHAKCGRFPIACPNQCESPKVVREELEAHLKDNCPALIVPCPFKEAGCRYKGPRYAIEKHQDEGMKQHLLLMCGLAGRQQQQLASLRSAVSRASLNYTGTFLWRISDVAAKIAEARVKEGFELISAPFYTSQYGYKLQASLFFNGNGSGEGAYVSIYIKILPGEYDALLKWPFSHTVSFTLYDQATNPDKACNIVESFIPDPTWENFQRPSREPDALGFGFPRFVSHEMLKKRPFIKDDVLFLKVRVDPSKNMAV